MFVCISYTQTFFFNAQFITINRYNIFIAIGYLNRQFYNAQFEYTGSSDECIIIHVSFAPNGNVLLPKKGARRESKRNVLV